MRYFSKKKISLLFSIIFLISVYLIIFSNDFPETPILPPLYSRRVLQNSTSDAQKYYNSSIHTVKLLGNIDIGYYYVNIFVGSPPQKQTVIVDTGSSLTAIPCSDCQSSSCGSHIDPHYDTSASSTFNSIDCTKFIGNYQCKSCDNNNKRCSFGIAYQEGSSLNGYLASDFVVLGDDLLFYYENRSHDFQNNDLKQFISEEKINFTFGCTTRETNLFFTQKADGILGLGVNSNTSSNIPNIIDFTFQQHKEINESLAFSLCYGYEGGYMTIGGYNSGKHLPNATNYVVPYSRRSGQYTINIYKAKMGNREIPLTFDDFNHDQGSFFDSGTTLFYAHSKVHNALMTSFYEFCNSNSSNCRGNRQANNCFHYDRGLFQDIGDFFRTFPPLSFQLDQEAVYTWDPEDYLFKDVYDRYCLPFNELPGRVILGGVFMRHYDILFDREAEKIHFTRSNCSDEYKGPYFTDDIGLFKPENKTQNETSILKDKLQSQTSKIIVALIVVAAVIIIIILGIYYIKRRKQLNETARFVNENNIVPNEEGSL